MNICDLSLTDLKKELEAGRLTSLQIVRAYKNAYETDQKTQKPLAGYIEFFDDVEEKAQKADESRAKGDTRPLLGLPFAVKDNIAIKGKACTCGSRILQGYIAPYSATVIKRFVESGAIPLGRTNMDEFAMGSSTEYSSYGPSRNPIDRDRTPGGSSGGSAALVAGGQAPFALGTETGGSVRLPASYCGIYGLKPSYGTLSRSGVVAFGSSLDQVGLFAKTADDIGLALSILAGKDERDTTSVDLDFSQLAKLEPLALKGLRIAIPEEFVPSFSAKNAPPPTANSTTSITADRAPSSLSPDVLAVFTSVCDWFTSQGAILSPVSIPVLEAASPSYYVIALAEAASNLSRFDGIRYGERKDPGEGFDELYVQTRSQGFNAEVKRRIIIGNYLLSSHFSGDTYTKALNVRARIESDLASLFTQYDLLLCPTSPTGAFPLGEKTEDPIAMYLSDLFTTFVNLARIPSLSIPAGKTNEGLPIGVQIAGPQFSEALILKAAKAWELSK